MLTTTAIEAIERAKTAAKNAQRAAEKATMLRKLLSFSPITVVEV